MISADGAADAAVVHFKDFLIGVDDEFVVDADFAKFIFNDGDALSVLLVEYTVHQGCFAGSEEAGEDGDGCTFRHGMRLEVRSENEE